jgi:hypothetical protein
MRGGEKELMVTKPSAQLYSPGEHRVAVPSNHTDMVKFMSAADSTYKKVETFIQDTLDKIQQRSSMCFRSQPCENKIKSFMANSKHIY